jgi:hypothetical protein
MMNYGVKIDFNHLLNKIIMQDKFQDLEDRRWTDGWNGC